MSANISLRKTGLVVFSSRMISVFTGLVFLLLMTHSLSIKEFGLWEVILDIITFACYPAGLMVFWATREIARGRLLGKTAIGMNLASSLFGIILYVVFSLVSASRLQSNFETLLLAVLLVPIGYWNQAANAVVSGHNPIVAGYSVLASEASKLTVAFPALLVLHAGIGGVVVSIMAANGAQAATSTYLTRDADQLQFDAAKARSWLAMSWIPSLTTLPYVLGVADTYIASLAASGTTLVGYYQAAFAVATIAGYSFFLATALYPLLLRGASDELTAATLDLTLLFGLPMAVGAAILARPILYLLKPAYTEVSMALTILAFSALVYSVSLILDQNLMGRDRVDVDERAGVKHYLGSSIFFVATVDIATAVTYLISVYLVITLGLSAGWSTVSIIEAWASAQLVVFSCYAAVKINRARTLGRLVVGRSLVNYAIGSGIMAAFLVVVDRYFDFSLSTLAIAAELTLASLAAVGIYLAYVLATEHSVRRLVSSVLRPITGRAKPSA